MSASNVEQTLVLIKPDALKNSLTGYVLSQLSEFHTGLRFAGAKIVHVNRLLAQEHYAEHVGKAFFPALLEYITGRTHYPEQPEKQRVIAIVYQGTDAVKKIRSIAGATNPHNAREDMPGTIRALGTVVPITNDSGETIGSRMDNLVHASATTEEAEREIKLWFRPLDIPPAMHIYDTEESTQHYYYRDEKLFTTHEEGTACILAPGDMAWKTDLEALQALENNRPATCSLNAVAAKYLINDSRAGD